MGILSVSNRVIPPVQRPSAGTDDVPKYNNDIFGYNKPTEQPVSRDTVPNGISQDEFDRIAVGMTYAQISGIIGGDGVLTDSGQNIHKVSYDTYSWIVENDLSLAVHVTFIEGKAYEIVADSSME